MSDRDARIGFVGAGRVAAGLGLALSRRGYRVALVFSRSRSSAERLASLISGCAVAASAQALVDACDLVFLTVPDDALADATAAIGWRPGIAAVHCSGAVDLGVLAPAARSGASVGGFHPLQMFADPEIAVQGLARCAIAVEAGEPLAARLLELAHALGARPLQVPAGGRAAYHAGAHYAGAFAAALLREAVRIWAAIGIPENDAVPALLGLLRGSTDAMEHNGLARAMAGSVSRGDTGTVRRHIEALRTLDPAFADFYSRLALRTVPLALERGSITPEKAEELKRVLNAALDPKTG